MQALCPGEAQVRWHTIAGLHQHDVTRHERLGRHGHALALPQHSCLEREHVLKHVLNGADRLFGLAFLNEAHQCVDEDYCENNACVGVVADGRRDRHRNEQDLQQEIVELRQEAPNGGSRSSGRQAIAPIVLQPVARLNLSQTAGFCL